MECYADRRHPRIQVYLRARCSVFSPGAPRTCIEGKTRDVSPGGAMLLLSTGLPLHTKLMVSLGEGPEVRGQVVWAGKVLVTHLGTVTAHGIAFTRDLEASVLKHILNGMQRQRYLRVPTRFPVEYSDLEKSGIGTCLNMSQGGMFIATTDLLSAGEDLLVHVSPPGLMHTFSLWSRVVWSNRLRSTNSFPAGIGVRFLKMAPTEATHLASLLVTLQSKAVPSVSASP